MKLFGKNPAKKDTIRLNENLPNDILRAVNRGDAFRGVATKVQVNPLSDQESFGGRYVLSFRLETHDSEGNTEETIPIQLQGGKDLLGKVTEGDSLVVIGQKNREGVVVAKKIYNTETKAEALPKKHSFVEKLFIVIFYIIFFVIFSVVLLFILGGFMSF